MSQLVLAQQLARATAIIFTGSFGDTDRLGNNVSLEAVHQEQLSANSNEDWMLCRESAPTGRAIRTRGS
jgi:hypothetical protein